MAKKTVKQPPHLRVRIDPKLIARLEKAREANGNTLTGEIVSRLEESFAGEDKMALLREGQQEARLLLEDSRAKIEQDKAALHREIAEAREESQKLKQDVQKYRAKHAEDVRQLQAELKWVEESTKREASVVDALLGEDVAAREAIRAVALLLADNPGWADTAESVHRITQGITESVKAAAKLEAKQ
jgi:hypothetical protein